MDDGVEYVSYDLGTFGSSIKRAATKSARKLCRNNAGRGHNITGADKVTYPSLTSEKKKKSSEQIAIGIVHKLQDASTENALVDIRFCPAKGKPQTAHRPDMLHQDIGPTMCLHIYWGEKFTALLPKLSISLY
jgi:hypothetical protein